MPLIQVRYNPRTIGEEGIIPVLSCLPGVAVRVLECEEGGELSSRDIMVEVNKVSRLDTNCKDVNIRVIAHDYPSRREKIDFIRDEIAERVALYMPTGPSWYVWVMLHTTSYASDTERLGDRDDTHA